jgi:hypothetical protein
VAGLSAAFCREWMASPYVRSLGAENAHYLLQLYMLEADGKASGMVDEVLCCAVGCPPERWGDVTRKWERHQVAFKRDGVWDLREFRKRCYRPGESTPRMRRKRAKDKAALSAGVTSDSNVTEASRCDAPVTQDFSVTPASQGVTMAVPPVCGVRVDRPSDPICGDAGRGAEPVCVTPDFGVTGASPEHVYVNVVSKCVYKNDVNVNDIPKKGAPQVSYMPGVAKRAGQLCMPAAAPKVQPGVTTVAGDFPDLVMLIPEKHRNERDLAILEKQFHKYGFVYVRAQIIYSVVEHVRSAQKDGKDPDTIFWKYLMGACKGNYAKDVLKATEAAAEAGRRSAEQRARSRASSKVGQIDSWREEAESEPLTQDFWEKQKSLFPRLFGG